MSTVGQTWYPQGSIEKRRKRIERKIREKIMCGKVHYKI